MVANAEFYFVHGWGCDSRLWDGWATFTKADAPVYKFDRGYFNGPEKVFSLAQSSLSKILITHSLGLHLIPVDAFKQIDLLVLISSFRYFHEEQAHEKVSKKSIRLMKQRLLTDPQGLLDDFYLNCGLNKQRARHLSDLNSELLHDDLLFLDRNQINLAELLQVKQILLLHGACDRIVSLEHSKRLNKLLPNSKLLVNESAEHGLPATDAQWCINAIIDNQKYFDRNVFADQIFPDYGHISANFSRQAHTYEQSAGVQRITAQRLASRIVKQAKVPADGALLEVGCGTGLLSEHLTKIFPDHSISFLDPATNMLEHCQQKLSKKFTQNRNILSTNHIFIESTIESYLAEHRYSKNKHVLIASSFALHWLLDLEQTLTQLLETLPIGGQLFFAFPLSGSFPEWQSICDQLNIAFTGNQLPVLDEIQSAVSSVGADIDCEEYSCPIYFHNALQFFQEMKMLGASTNKSLALANSKVAGQQTSSVPKLRSLIKTWNNQTEKTLGNDDSKIICTYKILEGTITRR